MQGTDETDENVRWMKDSKQQIVDNGESRDEEQQRSGRGRRGTRQRERRVEEREGVVGRRAANDLTVPPCLRTYDGCQSQIPLLP